MCLSVHTKDSSCVLAELPTGAKSFPRSINSEECEGGREGQLLACDASAALEARSSVTGLNSWSRSIIPAHGGGEAGFEEGGDAGRSQCSVESEGG